MEDEEEIQSRASSSPDPSPSPPPGGVTVTVASTGPPSYSLTPPSSSSQQQRDPNALALALLPSGGGGGGGGGSSSNGRASGGGGGREDCWSEKATGVLIDAWGEIHMELSRGNLKQKHWEKVAETVRSKEEDNGKTPKTDVQCKNRIDTVKKKYKQEKLRSGRSSWVFFDKLDRLIGSTAKISPAPPPPSGLGGGLHNIPMGIPMGRGLNLYHQQGKAETPRFGVNASESKRWPLRRKRNVSDSHSEDSGGDDSLPPPPPRQRKQGGGNKWREVSSAIMRFGEAYEQIENAKLQQVVEMEKERLRFLKELESQRMHFFVKFQFELSQQREENGKH